ncbi:MAG: hypothetical protein ACE5GC_00125 [Acidimicrobiia bacterium]
MTGELSFSTRRVGLPRVTGGMAALTFPLLLVVLAVHTGFNQDGGSADLAAAFLSAILLLVAEPVAWLFAFDFVDAGRFTIIFVGALTSFPLWYLVGSAIAARSAGWVVWTRRYVGLCLGWTALNLVGFFVLASLAG